MKNYNRAVTCQNPTSGLKSHISQLKYRFQMSLMYKKVYYINHVNNNVNY